MKILCAHQCYNKDKTFCLLPFYSVLVYPKQEKTGIGNTIILKDESCGDLQNQRCENQLTIGVGGADLTHLLCDDGSRLWSCTFDGVLL